MKPITKINDFKILPSTLLPKPAISLPKETLNTMQELRKGGSQAMLFPPFSHMLCWLLFHSRCGHKYPSEMRSGLI